MVERDGVVLDRSYVAYWEGVPVGVALVAMRPSAGGARTRLAAMGVLPAEQRAGIGQALVGRVIDDARAHGSRNLLLEVLESNTGARRLYEGHGFAPTRRLLGFSLRDAPLPAAHGGAPRGERVALRAASGPEILTLFTRCVEGESPAARPPWQLDAPFLARLAPSVTAYTITASCAGNSAVGYVVLSGDRPTMRLLHLGVLPEWRRRGDASAALAAARASHADSEDLRVAALVPEASVLVPFLRARGAVEARESQIESASLVGGEKSSMRRTSGPSSWTWKGGSTRAPARRVRDDGPNALPGGQTFPAWIIHERFCRIRSTVVGCTPNRVRPSYQGLVSKAVTSSVSMAARDASSRIHSRSPVRAFPNPVRSDG